MKIHCEYWVMFHLLGYTNQFWAKNCAWFAERILLCSVLCNGLGLRRGALFLHFHSESVNLVWRLKVPITCLTCLCCPVIDVTVLMNVYIYTHSHVCVCVYCRTCFQLNCRWKIPKLYCTFRLNFWRISLGLTRIPPHPL